MPTQQGQIGRAFLDEMKASLDTSFDRIRHCILQLPEAELNWRPFAGHNGIANIILHLCGNLRQWIGHGVGNLPDVRDRPREFSDRSVTGRQDLLSRLDQAVRECGDILATTTPESLLSPRRIQGFDATVLSAIVNSVTHFSGHAQEIIYITRLRLGDRYQFRWAPKTTEQGAPP